MRNVLILFLTVILLASCASPAPTSQPTMTLVPSTATPASTPAPIETVTATPLPPEIAELLQHGGRLENGFAYDANNQVQYSLSTTGEWAKNEDMVWQDIKPNSNAHFEIPKTNGGFLSVTVDTDESYSILFIFDDRWQGNGETLGMSAERSFQYAIEKNGIYKAWLLTGGPEGKGGDPSVSFKKYMEMRAQAILSNDAAMWAQVQFNIKVDSDSSNAAYSPNKTVTIWPGYTSNSDILSSGVVAITTTHVIFGNKDNYRLSHDMNGGINAGAGKHIVGSDLVILFDPGGDELGYPYMAASVVSSLGETLVSNFNANKPLSYEDLSLVEIAQLHKEPSGLAGSSVFAFPQ